MNKIDNLQLVYKIYRTKRNDEGILQLVNIIDEEYTECNANRLLTMYRNRGIECTIKHERCTRRF